MAEEVGVRLGVQNRSGFSREMGAARRDVDQFGTAASRAGARTSLATRAMGGMSRAGSMLRRTLSGVFTVARSAAVGIAAVGAAATLVAKKAIGDAADLGESINKTQVIFDRHAKGVLRWSRTTGDALGISRSAALDAAGGYGAMFQALGLGQKPAAAMSVSLVKLAADMGSLHNQDPTEMLDKIRAGMSGEMEPLKQFGIVLSETAVKEHAYAQGIAARGKELSEVQKIEARYSLLMKQSQIAHGDMQNTLDSYPNILRRLSAEFTNNSAVLGKRLLPAAADLAGWALDIMPRAFAAVRRAIDPTTARIARLATVMKDPAMRGKGLADKLRLSWELIIAQPFEAWWSKNGDRFTSRAAGLIGKGMGKVMRGMILAPLYVLGGDKQEIEDAGMKVGVRFWRSFLRALKPGDLAKRVGSGLSGAAGDAATGNFGTFGNILLGSLLFKGPRKLLGKAAGKVLGGLGGRAAGGVGGAVARTGAGAAVRGAGQTLALRAMYGLGGAGAAAGGVTAAGAATAGLVAAPIVALGYSAYKINQAGTEAQKQANNAIMAGIPLMEAYEKATRKGVHTGEDLVKQIRTEIEWARERGANQEEINALQDAATRILSRHNEWLRKNSAEVKEQARVLRIASREWKQFTTEVGGASLAAFSYVPPSMTGGGGGGGGGGSSAPSGKRPPERARGGPMLAMRPYKVGERGPEIVASPHDAHVISNDRAFGGAVHIAEINLNFPNVRRATQVEGRELLRNIQDAVSSELARR